MAEATTVSVLLQARDQASAVFDKVEGRMGKLSDSFAKHRVKIGLAATAIGAGIAAIGVSAIKSFEEERMGIRQLDAALKGAGASYDAQKDAIERVISAQQAKTNFGDEEQRVALRKLILASGDYENSLKALPALMDVAAGSGKSMEGVALAVGRAIGGEATALKAYGVTLDNTAGPLEVITALQEKFNGQAEAAADPMTQLKNRLGDLHQKIGEALIPVMDTLLPMMERITRQIIQWTEAHPGLTKVVVIAGAAFGALMLVLGPLLLILPHLIAGITALGVAVSIATGPIGIAALAIGVIAAALAPRLMQSFESTQAPISTFSAGMASVEKSTEGAAEAIERLTEAQFWERGMTLQNQMEAIRTQMDELGKADLLDFEGQLKDIFSGRVFTEALPEAWGGGDPAMRALQERLAVLKQAEAELREVWRRQPELLEEARGGVSGSLDAMEGDVRSFVDKVLDRHQDMADEIASIMGEFGNNYESGFNEVVETTRKQLDEMAANTSTFAERLDDAIADMAQQLADEFGELGVRGGAWSDSQIADFQAVENAADVYSTNVDSALQRVDDTFASQTARLEFHFSDQGRAWNTLGGNITRVLENVALVTGSRAEDIISRIALMKESGETWKDAFLRLIPQMIGPLDDLAEAFVDLGDKADIAYGLASRLPGLMTQTQADAQLLAIASQQGRDIAAGGTGKGWETAYSQAAAVAGDITIAHAAQTGLAGMFPSMAHGGIVNRPTLAMLGESGPEAVVPLGRGGGGSGLSVHLTVNGDINGMDDFEAKVTSVIRDAVLGGGFSGVLARA